MASAQQMLLLRHPERYPAFSIRNIAANGELWTGAGDQTRRCFPANASPRLKSQSGHIIVRVPPRGGQFQIIVTDNDDDADRVKLSMGPYDCR